MYCGEVAYFQPLNRIVEERQDRESQVGIGPFILALGIDASRLHRAGIIAAWHFVGFSCSAAQHKGKINLFFLGVTPEVSVRGNSLPWGYGGARSRCFRFSMSAVPQSGNMHMHDGAALSTQGPLRQHYFLQCLEGLGVCRFGGRTRQLLSLPSGQGSTALFWHRR